MSSSLGNNPARQLYANAEIEAGTSEFDEIKATRGMMAKSQGDLARKKLGVGKPMSPSTQARAEMGVDRPKIVVAGHRKIIRAQREKILAAKKEKEKDIPSDDRA
tara:strand:+ start:1118 stop:1432 length:315 start_codon:yes stop_codon:yes gene_type:complete